MRRHFLAPVGSLAMLCIACQLVFLMGCDVFSTRTPEPPDTGSTFIWTPATTVDYLVENFTGTLQLIDASNHSRCFLKETDSTSSTAKSYQFIPVPGLDQSAKSIFTVWNVESERSYLAKLKSLLPKNSKLTVLLSNKTIDQSTNPASLSADYTISLPVEGSSSILPSVVEGSLQMQLVLVATEQGTREWRIQSWSDFLPKSGNKNTWTDLKVKLTS